MRKPRTKAKLMLQREQIRVLEARELRHVAGGDSEVINSCPATHAQAVATQAVATACSG
jgi:hypothetical protein